MFDTIALNTDDRGVTTVTLNRPDRHNAMSGAMIADLSRAAEQLGRDPAVRAVVLTGAGESFCAGADLGWMKAQMAAGRADRVREARALAEMLGKLNALSKPLIGRVQGQAFGGGIGLISVCDVAVAANTAQFALSETRLGLIPATIGPHVVARLGAAMARRVFMSGRRFDAEEAVRLGLIARAVAPGELDGAVEAEVTPYLSAAPGAVADAKRLLGRLGAQVDLPMVAETIEALADRWETEEAQEGIAAFFDRRPPRWAD